MKPKYTLPLILIISLFFLWGFAHSILDVLNKHFQEVLVISKARSALVQSVVYGGYFLMALPAGYFINKWGYKAGILIGLFLYALGAFSFIPAEKVMSFNYFLLALFVIGSGLTFLETAANPYITVLGDPKSAASRLNLAQSFNGLGWIVGPLLGGLLIFKSDETHGSVALPYTIIGAVVIVVAFIISRIPLPEVQMESKSTNHTSGLWKDKIFLWGVIAMVFYVGAQTGINSFFINYITEINPEINLRNAALLLSFGGMGLFMIGRFTGSWLMKKYQPANMLHWVSIGAMIAMILVILALNWISTIALLITYLFESIMFPTIFAIAISQLGIHKKKGSSFLIMAIVGGALVPPLMGWIGENNMAIGFIIPFICFIVIFAYSIFLKRNTYIQIQKNADA
jgi:FHS family L-fucose permease-like MFS transporter